MGEREREKKKRRKRSVMREKKKLIFLSTEIMFLGLGEEQKKTSEKIKTNNNGKYGHDHFDGREKKDKIYISAGISNIEGMMRSIYLLRCCCFLLLMLFSPPSFNFQGYFF